MPGEYRGQMEGEINKEALIQAISQFFPKGDKRQEQIVKAVEEILKQPLVREERKTAPAIDREKGLEGKQEKQEILVKEITEIWNTGKGQSGLFDNRKKMEDMGWSIKDFGANAYFLEHQEVGDLLVFALCPSWTSQMEPTKDFWQFQLKDGSSMSPSDLQKNKMIVNKVVDPVRINKGSPQIKEAMTDFKQDMPWNHKGILLDSIREDINRNISKMNSEESSKLFRKGIAEVCTQSEMDD